MKRFDQEEFDEFVLNHGVIGFFEEPITMVSGRKSHFYCNWRKVSNDAYLLHELVHFVIRFVEDKVAEDVIEAPDCFYGVAEGATKLGVLTQYVWANMSPEFREGSHVLAMGRAKPKEHGAIADRFFVGTPRGNTIVLEDVTTTGGSLLKCLDQLIEANIPITATIGLTNRMELRDDRTSVADAVATRTSGDVPIPYFHLSDALSLLPKAVSRAKPSAAVIAAVEEEFRMHGVRPLAL